MQHPDLTPRRRPAIHGILQRARHSVLLLAALLALSLVCAEASGITPTNRWMDLYGSHSSFAGVPLPAGTYVAVFDSQGTQCGEQIITMPGMLAPVMPCYGDDSNTPADEGAVEKELLTFTVNGAAATANARTHYFVPVAADTPIIWKSLDLWEVDLVVPPQPRVGIALESAGARLTWQTAAVAVSVYQVWRSTDFACIPGASGVELRGTIPAAGAPLTWPETEGVGDPEVNYTYRVVSLDATGRIVGASQAVAEFDFTLFR